MSSGSIEGFDLGLSIGRVKATSEIKQVPRSLAPGVRANLELQLPGQRLCLN